MQWSSADTFCTRTALELSLVLLPYVLERKYKLGGWRLAWAEEAAECARQGHSPWGPHNRCLLALLAQAAVVAVVWDVWGTPGLVAHLTAAFLAQFYFTAMDYMLHYGLERPAKVRPACFERI